MQKEVCLRSIFRILVGLYIRVHSSSKTKEIYTHALDINNKDNVSPFDILVKLDTENGQPMNLGGWIKNISTIVSSLLCLYKCYSTLKNKMNPYIILGVIGSIASIISLVISWKIEKPKWIHGIYTFLLTFVIGLFAIHTNTVSKSNSELENENSKMKSIEYNAERIMSTYSNVNDVGENRGNILTAFSFLEKNKSEFPETYIIAKELVTNGLKVAETSYGAGVLKEGDEEERLKDGAATMNSILKGMKKIR